MKKTAILILAIFGSLLLPAQDITGQWNGVLKIQGTQLRIVFHIEKTGEVYSATMDSPDQGAKGIAVTTITFENNVLNLNVVSAGLGYEGPWKEEELIEGNLNQSGMTFPINLTREIIEKEKLNRPQEPELPYPYHSEEVSIENKPDTVKLAATLTLPSEGNNFPAVVLISGSGPQNRDEELLGHKPFLVISDYLTRNGIAVLRYDDRGTAGSTGNFKTATSSDFANDAEAAVHYLKTRPEINGKKIGLIGHSEGGIIAPMIAARSKEVSFIVLLAGTGIRGDQLLLMQQELIGRASGYSEADISETKRINKGAFEIVVNTVEKEKADADLKSYFKKVLAETPEAEMPKDITEDEIIRKQVESLTKPWMTFFLKHDPAIVLGRVKCPVLALNGKKDLQVPSKENLEAIRSALLAGGNKKVKTEEIPDLNHLFQECQTGSPEEYAEIEQTISPIVLELVKNWIKKQ